MINDPSAERQVAKKAEEILTAALRQKISSLGFKNHVSKDGLKKISEAKGKSNYKPGPTKDGGLRWYMNSLSMEMAQYGYIQHYGAVGVRSGGERTRHKPKTTSYNVRTHSWNLPEKDFIGAAIRQSGVIEFVLENITAIRGEEIMISLKSFFENE